MPLLGWMATDETSTVAVACQETTTRPLVPWCLSTVSRITRSDSTDDSTAIDSFNSDTNKSSQTAICSLRGSAAFHHTEISAKFHATYIKLFVSNLENKQKNKKALGECKPPHTTVNIKQLTDFTPLLKKFLFDQPSLFTLTWLPAEPRKSRPYRATEMWLFLLLLYYYTI